MFNKHINFRGMTVADFTELIDKELECSAATYDNLTVVEANLVDQVVRELHKAEDSVRSNEELVKRYLNDKGFEEELEEAREDLKESQECVEDYSNAVGFVEEAAARIVMSYWDNLDSLEKQRVEQLLKHVQEGSGVFKPFVVDTDAAKLLMDGVITIHADRDDGRTVVEYDLDGISCCVSMDTGEILED